MIVDLLFGAILTYYVTLHGIYFLLILIGLTQMRRYQQGIVFDSLDDGGGVGKPAGFQNDLFEALVR